MKINLLLKDGLKSSINKTENKSLMIDAKKSACIYVLGLVQKQIKSLQDCEKKLMAAIYD